LKGPFAQLDEKSFDPTLLVLWFEAGRRGAAKLLRTTPLPPDQIKAMISTMLEGSTPPDGFAERLAEASRGNPLYVDTVLRTPGKTELPASLDAAALQLC